MWRAAPRAIRGGSRNDGAWVPRRSHQRCGVTVGTPDARRCRSRARVDIRSVQRPRGVPPSAPIHHQCFDLGGHHLTERRRVRHRWTTSFLGAHTERRVPSARLPASSRRLLASGPGSPPAAPIRSARSAEACVSLEPDMCLIASSRGPGPEGNTFLGNPSVSVALGLLDDESSGKSNSLSRASSQRGRGLG